MTPEGLCNLNDFIFNTKECFSNSLKRLSQMLKFDISEKIPCCCLAENEWLIEKILNKAELEDLSLLQTRLKIPKKIERQIRKLMVLSSPDFEDLRQSIEALKSKLGDRLEIYNEHICYITEPIVLSGAELGRFRLLFSIELLGQTVRGRLGGIEANALEPNTRRDYYFHPHISDNYVCPGDAQNALALAITSLDIQAFFEILEVVLNTYNPESPYIKIEEWIGYTCDDCGTPGLSGYYMCEGEDCSVILCDDCALFCSQCEQYYCTSCYSQSEDLTKLSCPKCERSQCLSCWENTGTFCDSCEHWICPDCVAFICEECDDAFCDNCDNSEECESCKITFCADCIKNHVCEKEEEQ